jgi:hypothetical protein
MAATTPSMARRELIRSGAPSKAMISATSHEGSRHHQLSRVDLSTAVLSSSAPPNDGGGAWATTVEVEAEASKMPVDTAWLHCGNTEWGFIDAR